MNQRHACIVGGGMCKWGVREASYIDMCQEAAKDCLSDVPGLRSREIDGLIFASTYVGRRSCQVNTAPVVAERIGIKPSSICVRIDVLCAGGSTAILLAKALIESGMAETIMVMGCEKLYTPERWVDQYDQIASTDHDWDGPQGIGPPPSWFAMIAKEHMKHYGTKREDLAAVSVINYGYGADNPKAHFQMNLSIEKVLNAREVVAPLGLYDCTPITDGVAAAIVMSKERAESITNRPLVYVRGGSQLALHSASANFPGEHLGDWLNLRLAAKKAYESAKISPNEVNVAQVHDCFSISEIIEMEELGFCAKGEGGAFVSSGQTKIGGKIPSNTDGGLLSCGHPFGATGIRQGIEICKQLQGRARHQVEGAQIGLTHNLSGALMEHTIVIYGSEPTK